MSGNDNNPIAGGEHVITVLSAYIDGALDAAERDSVRAHLAGCGACRAEHAELVATRAMLRAVPAMQAPRSFTLTPEMARKVRPPSLFNRIFVPDRAPGLAMGSVLTFVLLFFVVVAGAFSLPNATFSRIGYGLNSGNAPSFAEKQADTSTTSSQAQATVTTGTAAAGSAPSAPEVQGFTAQGTPAPDELPPNAGGGLPDTDTTTAGSAPAPTPAPGSDASTMAAEAPTQGIALEQAVPPEASSRQAAPSGPPVDWGAALMSVLPLFLLAVGLALAVMAWIARRNRPA
jgi:anti-sigma factor RsiW